MKNAITLICAAGLLLMMSSCSIFNSKKSGCPSNGKNVGAEKLVSGDPEAEKAARKAKKFRS